MQYPAYKKTVTVFLTLNTYEVCIPASVDYFKTNKLLKSTLVTEATLPNYKETFDLLHVTIDSEEVL